MQSLCFLQKLQKLLPQKLCFSQSFRNICHLIFRHELKHDWKWIYCTPFLPLQCFLKFMLLDSREKPFRGSFNFSLNTAHHTHDYWERTPINIFILFRNWICMCFFLIVPSSTSIHSPSPSFRILRRRFNFENNQKTLFSRTHEKITISIFRRWSILFARVLHQHTDRHSLFPQRECHNRSWQQPFQVGLK